MIIVWMLLGAAYAYEEFLKGILRGADLEYDFTNCPSVEFSENHKKNLYDYASACRMERTKNLLSEVDFSIPKKESYTYSNGLSVGTEIRHKFAEVSETVLKFSPGKPGSSKSQIPLAIFHGLGDCCCFPGMKNFTAYMKQERGVHTECVEIGSGPVSSWLMPFNQQAQEACESLQKNPYFKQGLHVMGLSQGGLIARAVAEQCNLTVHSLVTLGGPHMGVATLPNCKAGFFCDIINYIADIGVYNSLVQRHFGPAGYFKDQFDYQTYLEKSNFLAQANNERTIDENYVKKLAQIDKMVLVKFQEDTVVDPPESEWFGYYKVNTRQVVPMNLTQDYLNNYLGLKALSRKIVLHSIEGNHLEFTFEDIKKLVLPYLN